MAKKKTKEEILRNELEMAAKWLTTRKVNTFGTSKKTLNSFVQVIPYQDVEFVLQQALSGKFIDFYDELKDILPDELVTFMKKPISEVEGFKE